MKKNNIYQYDSGENYVITNDTVINGRTYYEFSKFGTWIFGERYIIYRFDEDEQILYCIDTRDTTLKEYIAADMKTPAGQLCQNYYSNVNVYSEGITDYTFMGRTLKSFAMNTPNQMEIRHVFVDSIGLMERKSKDPWPPFQLRHEKVVGYIIDSVVWYPSSVQVLDLDPLIDRPVNAFPFVMNMYFGFSNNNFIKELKLNLIHMRDTDTILVNSISMQRLSNTWAYANINLTGLQAGDRLLVRGYANDKSIFNSYDYYPDSGNAVINILPFVTGTADENTSTQYNSGILNNFPNPFNPETIIRYRIGEYGRISLKVYDIFGREAAVLADEVKTPGEYESAFNGSNLSSGTYIYILRTGNKVSAGKMILMK